MSLAYSSKLLLLGMVSHGHAAALCVNSHTYHGPGLVSILYLLLFSVSLSIALRVLKSLKSL